MLRTKMLRTLRMAALAAAVSMVFASLAWGYDDDDYHRPGEASAQGYRNGYHDGQRSGQYDYERGRRFNFKNDQWEDAHGYEHWMGSHGTYKHAYREGYEQGYRRAFGDPRGWDRDRDDYRRPDRDNWR
jgi:hypothetical protein